MKIKRRDLLANQNIFIIQGKFELWNRVGFMIGIQMRSLLLLIVSCLKEILKIRTLRANILKCFKVKMESF